MILPTLSVLCSSYNSSRFIEGYCDSLNNQLLSGFEIIYVDAASTDDSLERFKSFKFRDGIKVTIIESKEKITIYEAWNLAIEARKTDYCLNYNTDDRLYPAALSTMLNYSVSFKDADLIYSRCYIVKDPEHKNIVDMFDWPEYSHAELLKKSILGPFPLLKRQAIIDAGMFNPEYWIIGDYEMWLRMSKMGCKFKKVPETIGSYYFNPFGVSTDNSTKIIRAAQNEKAREKHK